MNQLRPDFSNALIHLTRKRKGEVPLTAPGKMFETSPDKDVTAFEVLKEILLSGKIEPSLPDVGYIKGRHSVTCFSEISFSGLKYLLAYTKKYEPYGLIFSKHSIFKQGGRPVIYLPDAEIDWIPQPELWRVVRYEPLNNVDFSFEREWRLNKELVVNETAGFYVLVKTISEAREIEKLSKKVPFKLITAFIFDHLSQMF